MPLEGFDDIEPKPKIGRPKAEIDLKVLHNAASIGCTVDEMAALCGVHRDTLFARADEPDIKEAIETGRDIGRATLRRMQWQGAKDGNPTMLIWLGKQLLKQRDNLDQTINGNLVINRVNYGSGNDPT